MSTVLSLAPDRRNVRARGPGRSIRTEDWGHTGWQAAPMSGDSCLSSWLSKHHEKSDRPETS